MIPTIGIVGGIGSGKSLVADALHKLGGYLINADALGHEALMQPDIKAKLIERWGSSILDASGNPDRRTIGRIVFANPAELKALESLVFPFIESRIMEEVRLAQAKSDTKFIVLDAAIMIETGWSRICDKVVFVDAPAALRLDRLQQNRGWDERELERRESRQLPLEEKRRHADAVIVNDGAPEKTAQQVKTTLEQWKVI